MKRSDWVLLSAVGGGLFMAGAVWRPAFGDYSKFKDAMECMSFLATTVAAIVAIYTLRAWKDQFRHAERFATLRAVKDAIADLHVYRRHLLSVVKIFRDARANGGKFDQQLILREELIRQQLLSALSTYRKAWAAAVAFFTPEEEQGFVGTPDAFMKLYRSRARNIQTAHEQFSVSNQASEFDAVVDAYDTEAKALFLETLEAIETMIRRKI